MKYALDTISVHGSSIAAAHFPGKKPEAAIYMLSGGHFDNMLPEIMAQLYHGVNSETIRPFVLVLCSSDNWNGAFSPWSAPPLAVGEEPFSGGAGQTIDMCSQIKKQVCRTYSLPTEGERHFLLGYSLAGLCALYGLYISADFGGAGCCSASLWYDGWREFMSENSPAPGSRIYISLGKKEERIRSARMGSIGKNCRHAVEILNSQNCHGVFCLNNGGHDYRVPGRIAAAAAWLLARDMFALPEPVL
jgi:predicted alpha/beta superfamily hydrolase